MKNNKLILGFLFGGLIGGSIFYLLRANKQQKKLFLSKLGKIVDKMGDLLKEISIENKDAAIEEIVKAIPKMGNAANLLMLAAMSLSLYKKWR